MLEASMVLASIHGRAFAEQGLSAGIACIAASSHGEIVARLIVFPV
jgi:hypothetical protein